MIIQPRECWGGEGVQGAGVARLREEVSTEGSDCESGFRPVRSQQLLTGGYTC